MAIDTTVGGVNSNSFITLVEADDYHADRHHNATGWDDLSDAVKSSLIVWSTRILNRLQWDGSRYTYQQALAFPRYGLYEDDRLIDVDEIPDRVKEATAELAYQLGLNERMAQGTDARLSSVTLGDLSIDYVAEAEGRDKTIPRSVAAMISCWAQIADSDMVTAKVVRT